MNLELSKGKVAIVDDEDHQWLMDMGRWCLSSGGYGTKRSKKNDKWPYRKMLLLHRIILDKYNLLKQDELVDHINGDILDNRKDNLRNCTKAQNQRNRKSNKNSTSKYKGVSWHNTSRKWQVHIKVGEIRKHLGLFENEKEAAKAYDQAAIKYHDAFANVNFKNI